MPVFIWVSVSSRMASAHPECPTRLQGRDSAPETLSHPPAEAHGRDQVRSPAEGRSSGRLPVRHQARPGGNRLP